MKDTLQNTLNKSALMILKPLARIMIRNGVSCGNFEALVRKAYVDEAFAAGEAQSSNGKTTVSKVSAQTGLSRKEVKRLRELEEVDIKQNDERYNRATRVISGWLNHPGFSDDQGNPLSLSLETDSPSFAELVKQFSGDVTTKTMLDLLMNSHCIEFNDGKVSLIKRAYLPGTDSSEIALILGVDTAELIETINHNMIADKLHKHFQRKVSTHKLKTDSVDAFKQLCNTRSQVLLEELDQWLSEHETDQDDGHYVSLGIYYYQPTSQGNDHEKHI